MNCEAASARIRALASGELAAEERAAAMVHIEHCAECRSALHGAEALNALHARGMAQPPEHFFNTVIETVGRTVGRAPDRSRFWLGAGFGAVAASIFAIALFLNWGGVAPTSVTEQFLVSLDEPRTMSIAFETDKKLSGATISILLAGDIEIDGYGTRRELSWSENLEAGVNRLSLPIIANGISGGQMVVRLTHPLSEQVFVVQLPVES